MADNSPPPPLGHVRSLLTVNDVAEILRLNPRSVRRLIADGRLPVVRLRGAVRIRPEAVEELIASGGQMVTRHD
jgi:excisionase family DNA binding protein